MTILASIQVMRDTCAHSAVDEAIERIRDDLDRYLPAMEPEEREHTLMGLERLLDLQAAMVRSATSRGTTMFQRKAAEATERTDWFGLAASLVVGEGREAA